VFECGINGTVLAVTDGCDLPDNTLYLSDDGSVLYNSSADIAGVMFDVDGATINNGSGGDADAATWTISTLGNSFIAHNATNPISGCGILAVLDITGEGTGLSDIGVSDPTGNALPFRYYESDCIVNNADYECVYDCFGTLNGTREIDECGVCGEPACTVPGPPKAPHSSISLVPFKVPKQSYTHS
jgi:hypothetical protein